MGGHFILVDDQPVAVDLMTWARWFEKAERHIADTCLGDVRVSTVFLGLDHSFVGGPPVLWETMIFNGPNDGYEERYTSREDALAGHAKAVEIARTGARDNSPI